MDRQELERKLTELVAAHQELDKETERLVLVNTFRLKEMSGKIAAYQEILEGMPLPEAPIIDA